MRQAILDILVNELNYQPDEANMTANDLTGLDARLLPTLKNWLANREISDAVFNDKSLLDIMGKTGFDFPKAMIVLNWLIDEPKDTKLLVGKKEIWI